MQEKPKIGRQNILFQPDANYFIRKNQVGLILFNQCGLTDVS